MTQTTDIDISIIIVNYKASKLINDCIESIFQYTEDVTYEIIIVDNNTEKLNEVIYEAQNPIVHLLQLEKNIGFGLANNEGVKMSKGRHIFCLNPDTILLNNAIKILSHFLDSHPDVGACGGNLFDENMLPALSFRRNLPGIKWDFNELLNHVPEKIVFGKNRKFNYTASPINVGYISGADIMIPRNIFEKTGGFSPEFFLYFEETDLCARILKLGKRIVSVPQAKIQHLEGKSFGDAPINYFRLDQAEQGRLVFLSRNRSKLSQTIANLIYRTFLFSRAVLKNSESYRYRLNLQNKLKK